jgi:hypothetical protein
MVIKKIVDFSTNVLEIFVFCNNGLSLVAFVISAIESALTNKKREKVGWKPGK